MGKESKKAKAKKADKKAAELAAKNAKKMLSTEASKKAQKKAKEAKKADAKKPAERHPHLVHLDKIGEALAIVRDKETYPKKERQKAARFLDEARAATEDRNAAKALAELVDRGDAASVAAYNEVYGKATGTYLTSDEEREREHARLIAEAEKIVAAVPDADVTDEERKARVEAKRAARAAEIAAQDGEDDIYSTSYTGAPEEAASATPERQEVEEVETETGREFAAGPATEAAPTISGPAGEVDPTEFELNGNGQYKVWNPEKKAERGYTRVTTYIDCLEDKKRLTEWKTRQVLIGAGLDLAATEGEHSNAIITRAVELYDAWAKAYRKIAKREAKGEVELGQFGLLRAAADKALKDGVNVLTELAMDYAGANEKREKGTELHGLTELLDRGELKLDDEAEWIEKGLATHADFADLRAYDAKMRELGIEHVYIEKRVVLDGLKVAGTLDRGSYYKLPGTSRRTKLVADLKTGGVEYSPGKIGMQLALYSQGEGYDRQNPEARENLGLSKTKALLIHLPAGEAKCEVYIVDLGLATKGLKLAAEVRSWRNTGKKVYDLKAPLTAV